MLPCQSHFHGLPRTETHCYSATRLMTSPQPWRWGNGSRASPLRREDSIKHGVPPVVRSGRQHEHVLDDIEGETIVWQRTQELGLQEGRPFLLQDSLSSLVPLQHKHKAVSSVACRGRHATGLTAVCHCQNGPQYWTRSFWYSAIPPKFPLPFHVMHVMVAIS